MSELPYERPEDFNRFWEETVQEAMAIPLDGVRAYDTSTAERSHSVQKLSLRGSSGDTLSGWISTPQEARRLPAYVWLPPYGRESVLPNRYGTASEMVTASLNFFGEDAFHQEKYLRARGYFGDGIDEPETWIFRRLFIDSVLLLRFLRAQPEVDEDRIGAAGISQAGGIAVWLGAHVPIVRAVIAHMPFLSRVGATLLTEVYRYPLTEVKEAMVALPLGEARVMNTLSYFDTSFQAAECTKPTLVTLGLKDPACRPPSVRAVYEALPGEKKLVELDWGHDYHPEMERLHAEWFGRHLGSKPDQGLEELTEPR